MLPAEVNKVLDISQILHIINPKAKLNTLLLATVVPLFRGHRQDLVKCPLYGGKTGFVNN